MALRTKFLDANIFEVFPRDVRDGIDVGVALSHHQRFGVLGQV